MDRTENLILDFANFIWGTPLLILLLGGGLLFLIYSELIPIRYFRHAIQILRGKYDDPNEKGQINHYQALSTALAATVGMGNISGVAVAITMGGPGAIFWMWISALFGVSTKFFTGSLAVMYRGKDSSGTVQGGPMYYITQGLGKKWKPMAVFFSLMGMFAVLPIFQANQLTQVIRDVVLVPNGWDVGFTSNLIIGISISLLMVLVIFGGIKRIGQVTGRLVPLMVVVYIIAVIYIILKHYTLIGPAFSIIFEDAFTGNAVLGGSLGAIIIAGVRRAAFSNEAGIGTAPMAHGAAKTNEPIREGLVAMLGPIIDTLIVCTFTALAILVTGVWQDSSADGITLTALAFEKAMPVFGPYLLIVCVSFFSLSTMFAFPYYGSKCSSFVFGTKTIKWYNAFSSITAIVGSVISLNVVVAFCDATFALMAFPNMLAALLLAPRVKEAAKDYFARLKRKDYLTNTN
ncbi:MAG: alanine/glycine:cation symporter family protein [Prolixibacteraceae bacterium]|jgi:AGCS family alanine or glycine:cation symporter|nr:alanine/glycine:cation symporter family protein [Prolixibacteraceae bacterium]